MNKKFIFILECIRGFFIGFLIGICLVILVICMSDNVNAFTTEDTIVLNKVAMSSNLLEQQTIKWFELQEDLISNETKLIEETRDILEDHIEEMNESIYEEIKLININYKNLKQNISNLEKEEIEEKNSISTKERIEENRKEYDEYIDCKRSEIGEPIKFCDEYYPQFNLMSSSETKTIQNTSVNKEEILEFVVDNFKEGDIKYDKEEEQYFIQFPQIKSPKNYDDEVEDLEFWNNVLIGWCILLTIFCVIIFFKSPSVPYEESNEMQLTNNNQEERLNKTTKKVNKKTKK